MTLQRQRSKSIRASQWKQLRRYKQQLKKDSTHRLLELPLQIPILRKVQKQTCPICGCKAKIDDYNLITFPCGYDGCAMFGKRGFVEMRALCKHYTPPAYMKPAQLKNYIKMLIQFTQEYGVTV